MSKELTETPIAEYRPTEAALADLRDAATDALHYFTTVVAGSRPSFRYDSKPQQEQQ